MQACSFFTWLLYTVHVSSPHSNEDNMMVLQIFLFPSYEHVVVISASLEADRSHGAYDILFCSSASM